MIKFVEDRDADLLTNGQPLQITRSQYENAKVFYKWCLKCHKLTEHRVIPDPLKGGTVGLCNGASHE